jgi:hypothetical protein
MVVGMALVISGGIIAVRAQRSVPTPVP